MPALFDGGIPEVDSCCGYITDLRAASAIIAIIGIVTSPVVSWTLIRHSYVIRVACYVSADSDRSDVVDLTLNNVISFGFGINAGLGPSCLSKNVTSATSSVLSYSSIVSTSGAENSSLFTFVKGFGWAVLATDTIFVLSCIYFLAGIFENPSHSAALAFMICAFIAILFSSIYGILYVICCMSLGGNLPLFELFFAFFDLILWCYFIVVFTGAHSIAMCFNPTCEDMFDEENDGIVTALIVFKWLLFVVNILFITSTFGCLLGIFLAIPHRETTGDVFIGCSMVWAVLTLIFAILEIIQYRNCACTNPNDIIVCSLYPPCMIYFIIIVSSFLENMEKG